MRIQNNITAMNTHRMYTMNNSAVAKSAEKLSSGYRINRAGDDAAGLAISEKMRSQIRGLNMASKNSLDAVSLIQTAEGALQEVHSMLQRMNELANQAATGTNEKFDREQINAEFNQLKEEIDQVATTTQFNKMNLLDGSLGKAGVDVTDLGTTVGVAFGEANTAIAGGTAAASIVTKWEGITASKNGTFSFELGDVSSGTWGASATGSTVRVTFEDGNTGAITTTDLSWEDVFTNNLEATGGTDNQAAIGAGDTATLDLTGVGLGRITLAGAETIDNLKGAFHGAELETTEIPAGGAANSKGQLVIQVGANEGDTLAISVDAMDTKGLGVDKSDISEQASAGHAITSTQGAINKVSEQRATLGAMQNRLEHKIANLDNTSENLSAAESRIRDVDVAKEMTTFTKNNILSQAATAMLAQANAAPQGVLSLLQ